MIDIVGLDHVVFRVADVERMLRFYTDVLGGTEALRIPPLGMVQVRMGDCFVDLVSCDGGLGAPGGAAPGAEGRNVHHVAFRLSSWDETAIRDKLAANNVPVIPVPPPPGATPPFSIYISDPEGNALELLPPPPAVLV
jgi:glyoxylase I family protein